MMPKIPYLRTGYYNNFDLLKVDLARGRMTIDEAAKIALQNKLFTAANPNDIEAVRQLFISHLVNKK